MALKTAAESFNEITAKAGSSRKGSFISPDSWRAPFVLFLATFLLWFMYLVGSPFIENHCSFVLEPFDFKPSEGPSSVPDSDGTTAVSSPECNIWMGRWIRDMSYPVRKNATCACLRHTFDCKRLGRVDDGYMHYRWQPFDCDIPRFNAEDFLERTRGKKIVFVGDSLNRNHFVSLVCLLGDAVPIDTIKSEMDGPNPKNSNYVRITFSSHNLTILTMKNVFLLHKLPYEQEGEKFYLRLHQIDPIISNESADADFVIFNTYNWFYDEKLRNTDMEMDGKHFEMDPFFAFLQAVRTLFVWMERFKSKKNIKFIYKSLVPQHYSNRTADYYGECWDTVPLTNVTVSPSEIQIQEYTLSLIREMKNPPMYLDLQYMSHFRTDAHFNRRSDSFNSRTSNSDCCHWCVPGVPDIWNELMYFELLRKKWI